MTPQTPEEKEKIAAFYKTWSAKAMFPVPDDAITGYVRVNSLLDTYQEGLNKELVEMFCLPPEVMNGTNSAHTSPQ